MQEKITISIPKGETIIQEVEKLVGRQSMSSVIRDALKLYKNKAIMDGDSWCNKIPDWRVWKQEALKMSDKDLDEAITRLEQLVRISKKTKVYNSGILRSGIDF